MPNSTEGWCRYCKAEAATKEKLEHKNTCLVIKDALKDLGEPKGLPTKGNN
jgi:hypothetical protein